MNRPRSIEGGRSVSTILPLDLYSDLAAAASARELTLSETLRRAVAHYLHDLPALDAPKWVIKPAPERNRWWRRG